MTIKEYIEQRLKAILFHIDSYFANNELAYITLQQKNERQVCDKVAWRLQNDIDSLWPGQYIVRREWPSLVDAKELKKNCISKRSAVDIAILKMNSQKTDYEKVVAMIEFKAHSFLNKETWQFQEFCKDMGKMEKMADRYDEKPKKNKRAQYADLYFVYLLSAHDKNKIKEYKSAVVYKDILDNKNTILYDNSNKQKYYEIAKLFWDQFYNILNVKIMDKNKLESQTVSLGHSFGYNMYLTSMVLGPIKASTIKIISTKPIENSCLYKQGFGGIVGTASTNKMTHKIP